MKTKNLSSESNGISIAVNVGTSKPVYATPTQLRALLSQADALRAELETWPSVELEAIDARASLDPDSRKAARINAARSKLQAAVSAATSDAARAVAELELKLFEMKNA